VARLKNTAKRQGAIVKSVRSLPRFDSLESRVFLSVTSSVLPPSLAAAASAQNVVATPAFSLDDKTSKASYSGGTSPGGFTPAQIARAYGLNNVSFGGVTGNGAGQTIAIVDAYDDPTISTDLQAFDQYFNLPNPPSFTKVNETGGSSMPAADSTGTWEIEESLDVEWAHALAPNANIMLVEASSTYDNDLFTAAQYAASVPGVSAVSMSFAGPEFYSETYYDSYFTTPSGHAGVTFLAASGDNGDNNAGGTFGVNYPAASPNILSVGGTQLSTDSQGNYSSESAWNGSGGGVSSFETQPNYQNGVVTQSSSYRTLPDVSFNASPSSGVPLYDSYSLGASTPWMSVGGTSFAAPAWAALIAIANQGRASEGYPSLDGRSQTLPALYNASKSDFHDITSGNNGFSAGPGYDLVTGIGTPIANLLLPALAAYGHAAPANPPTVAQAASASSTTVTGTSTTLSVLGADSQGESSLLYTWAAVGTVPSPVSFSANGTNASKNTTVSFSAIGTYQLQVTITDPNGLSTTSTVTVTVTPTVSSLSVSPSTTKVNIDGSQQLAAVAFDQFGNVVTNQPVITWTLAGGSIGSVNSSGLYSAPAAMGSATIVASANSVTGSATVTVAMPAPSSWTANGGGSWTNAADWSAGVPDNAFQNANFAVNLSQASTVTLDGNQTVGSLVLDSAQPYTIASGSGGSLTINAGTRTAQINVTLGSDVISAPLVLDSNVSISLPNAGQTLTLSGGISGSGTLTVTGLGKVILAGAGNTVAGLTVNTGASLDLTSESLLINYAGGTSPQSSIQSYLSTGALVSSFVGSNSDYGIGYSDGADGIVSGLTSGQFVLEPALIGDANLDGNVNIIDLQLLLANWNSPGGWDHGNFFDGAKVGIHALQALLQNFGHTSSLGAATFADAQIAPTVDVGSDLIAGISDPSASFSQTPISSVLD
jgi:hypothetical protein